MLSGWSANSAAAASAGHSGTARATAAAARRAFPLPFPCALSFSWTPGSGLTPPADRPARAKILRANRQARTTTARWMRTFVTCQTRGRKPAIAWFAANSAEVSGRGIPSQGPGVRNDDPSRTQVVFAISWSSYWNSPSMDGR